MVTGPPGLKEINTVYTASQVFQSIRFSKSHCRILKGNMTLCVTSVMPFFVCAKHTCNLLSETSVSACTKI